MNDQKSNFRSKTLECAYGIFILAAIIIAFVYHGEIRLAYSSPETIKQYIESFGILAPVMFIALYTLKAVFFIIPTTPFAVASGYLFGGQLSQGLSPIALVILIVLGLIILGYLFRHRLRVLLIKEIKEYEEGIKGIEKKPLKGIKALKYDVKYEFHKWKKQLLIADKIFTIALILFLGIYRPDYVVIAAYFLLIPYLILTQRKSLFNHLVAASLVAITWMLIAKKQYAYNHEFLALLGINLYPLFAWAVGLFLIYVLYSHYEHILKEEGFLKQFLLFMAFYIPLLIAFETIAYHAFSIHNVATAAFPGLPICGCMHGPRWMQLAYFAIGPIFFSLCYIFKLENPHLDKNIKVISPCTS